MDYSTIAELYAADGTLQSKRFVEIQFFVHMRESFEALARAQGYGVTALYGEYARNEFRAEDSLFMIWVLGKRGGEKQVAQRPKQNDGHARIVQLTWLKGHSIL